MRDLWFCKIAVINNYANSEIIKKKYNFAVFQIIYFFDCYHVITYFICTYIVTLEKKTQYLKKVMFLPEIAHFYV